jgi:hypothetical protein
VTDQELLDELQAVCRAMMHEAVNPKLTSKQIFSLFKVVNSAAQICAKLQQRIKRDGREKAVSDIHRFVEIAIETIQKLRRELGDP